MRDPGERYKLLAVLAKSMFGQVCLAWDTDLERKVAIKLCSKRAIAEAKQIDLTPENPRTEVTVMKLLAGHPNVLALYDHFEHNNVEWIVMEYGPGGALLEWCLSFIQHGERRRQSAWRRRQGAERDKETLRQRDEETQDQDISNLSLLSDHDTSDVPYSSNLPSLPTTQALQLFNQILAGVSFIHASGHAHLDLSLENVLVGAEGQLKVCDFGLARPSDASVKEPTGKLFYMAPELAAPSLQPKSYDLRQADMFSLGVVLFMLVVGHPPFDIPSSRDPRYKLLLQEGVAALLKTFNCFVPDGVVELLECLLVPWQRRISVDEASVAVRQLLAPAALVTHPPHKRRRASLSGRTNSASSAEQVLDNSSASGSRAVG